MSFFRRSARTSPVMTPGLVLVRGVVLLLAFWWGAWWLGGIAAASAWRWNGAPPLEARAQLRNIEWRLSRDAADRNGKIFFEGRLFVYSFYGFALVNMATADPANAALREHALRQLERIIPIAEELGRLQPFDAALKVRPSGGIIAAGHRNLLRAGYAILGGKRPDILRDYREESATFSDLYRKSPTGVLESYHNLWWPVDNCCALESLRLHDSIYGTTYSEVSRKFASCIVSHLDPETSMMVAQIDEKAGRVEGPRGCALSWTLAFLPMLAPELAREQYTRYRDNWFIHVWGATGVREWPPGRGGTMDVDSGPVFCDIGAAASGFGIAAAKANGDAECLTRMLRGMELACFPVTTINGEKRYFAGQVLLTDVLALWGKTMHPWDRPSVDMNLPWSPVHDSRGSFVGILAICTLIVLLLVVPLLWSFCSALRRYREQARPWNSWRHATRSIFMAQLLLLVVWLAIPRLSWLVVMLAMGLLSAADRLMAGRESLPEADAVE